jgi:Ankyrin repeats (3 copies)
LTVLPKEYLANLLQSRGYAIQPCDAHAAGYCQPASPLQIACFTDYMINLVKADDADTLRQLLATDYISFNPANVFGESVVSIACRFGSIYILQMLIEEFRVNVSIADSYGRTCLHEACWNSQIQWPIVELLLGSDPHLLFVADVSGKVPMDYCPNHPDITNGWIQFIDQKKDDFWPVDAQTKEWVSPMQKSIPYCVSDCMDIDTDSIEHAKLVASGNMHPDQVTKMFRLGTSLDELYVDDSVSACYTSCEDDTDGTEYLTRSRNSFDYDMLESELAEFLDALDQNFRQLHCKSHSTKNILGRSHEDEHLEERQLRRETLHL